MITVTTESAVVFLLVLFVVFTIASSCGIVIGVYMLFDSSRKSCQAEIKVLRGELMKVRLDAESREQDERAKFESLQRKHQELSDLVIRLAKESRTRVINIESGNDMSIGEFVGQDKDATR